VYHKENAVHHSPRIFMMVCLAAFRPSTYLSNLFFIFVINNNPNKGHVISFMRLQNKNVADIEDKFRHHFKCGFVILEEKLPLCKAA